MAENRQQKIPKKLNMNALSSELVQEILSRLPIPSLFHTRLVCKTWRNLIDDPSLPTMHLNNSSSQNRTQTALFILSLPLCQSNPKPQLHYLPDVQNSQQLTEFHNLPLQSSQSMLIHLVGTCNGFLCFSVCTAGNWTLCVINPVTGEHNSVKFNPSCNQLGGLFGFGLDPKKGELKLVKLHDITHTGVLEVWVSTVGSPKWRFVGHIPRIAMGPRTRNCGVFINGCLHWLVTTGRTNSNRCCVESIVALDLGDEELRYIELPLHVGVRQRSVLGLGVLGGFLVLIDGGFRDFVEVWVMRDYGVEESWVRGFVITRPVGSFKGDKWKPVQLLGVRTDGEILIQCESNLLRYYDPQSGVYSDIELHGVENCVDVVPHVPSFIQLLK